MHEIFVSGYGPAPYACHVTEEAAEESYSWLCCIYRRRHLITWLFNSSIKKQFRGPDYKLPNRLSATRLGTEPAISTLPFDESVDPDESGYTLG